jgi:hypothetical protein
VIVTGIESDDDEIRETFSRSSSLACTASILLKFLIEKLLDSSVHASMSELLGALNDGVWSKTGDKQRIKDVMTFLTEVRLIERTLVFTNQPSDKFQLEAAYRYMGSANLEEYLTDLELYNDLAMGFGYSLG